MSAYLNKNNPKTFLNGVASAKAAGYNCSSYKSFGVIGAKNRKKLDKEILKWLDDNDLSESALKLKGLSLLEAKKTVREKLRGHLDKSNLPEGVTILATTHRYSASGKGEQRIPYDEGETLIGIDVEALEIQARIFPIMCKIRGILVEKHELTGKDGEPIKHEHSDAMSRKALDDAINSDT